MRKRKDVERSRSKVKYGKKFAGDEEERWQSAALSNCFFPLLVVVVVVVVAHLLGLQTKRRRQRAGVSHCTMVPLSTRMLR